MSLIPKRKNTRHTLNTKMFGGKPRDYLGMSESGEPCLRKRWYKFHWCSLKQYSARVARIFNIGHLFEELIIKELKESGMEVFRRDVDGNKIEIFGRKDEPQEELLGFCNHAKGHIDGRILGITESPKTEHLLELKTMSQKYFLGLVRKGVQESNPKYYGQCQRYMEKTKLNRCLFIAINKNDSDIHIERIKFDAGYAQDLARAESTVILAYEPPDRFYKKTDWQCHERVCEFRSMCYEGGKELEKNCRTCNFSDLEKDGKWFCGVHSKNLSSAEQLAGCDRWKKGWYL